MSGASSSELYPVEFVVVVSAGIAEVTKTSGPLAVCGTDDVARLRVPRKLDSATGTFRGEADSGASLGAVDAASILLDVVPPDEGNVEMAPMGAKLGGVPDGNGAALTDSLGVLVAIVAVIWAASKVLEEPELTNPNKSFEDPGLTTRLFKDPELRSSARAADKDTGPLTDNPLGVVTGSIEMLENTLFGEPELDSMARADKAV